MLFVDYMAEHLTATGRAAIVVPEGIIFQSGTAYKALRKLLVNTSLVAVVSLPAGVFNPYSGVKTNILILDKRLHKQLSSVLFVKVSNDGFNLGAQRRAVANSDLPEATRLLKGWMTAPDKFEGNGVMAHAVERARLAESGDFNLSGDRYQVAAKSALSTVPMTPLGDICTFKTGGTPTSSATEYYEGGTVPWLVSGDIHQKRITDCDGRITEIGVANSNAKVLPYNSVLIALNGQGKTRGTVALLKMRNATCNQSLVAISPVDTTVLLPDFLFSALSSLYQDIRNLTGDEQRSGLNIPILKTIRIPLPPLEVQNQIVAEIEGYQKIIDGARLVLDNYKPHIVISPAWPVITLGEACKAILTGPFGTALHESDYVPSGIPVINPKNIVAGEIVKVGAKAVAEATRDKLREFTVRENDIVIGRRGEMGRCAIVTSEMNGWLCGTGCFVIRLKDECDVRFAHIQLTSQKVKLHLEAQAVGVTMMNLNQGILSGAEIPLPDLPTQHAIVAEIEAEQALVNANRELIRRMEAKVKAAIDRVWGEA